MIVSELLSSDVPCPGVRGVRPYSGARYRTTEDQGPGGAGMDHYQIQQQLHHLGVNIRTSVDSQTPLRLHPIKVKL